VHYALSSPVPAVKTLTDGYNYWASDACHYYVSGGRWYGDYCVRYDTSTGTANPNVWDFYQYDPTTLSKLAFQVDKTDPAYFSIRVLTDPAIFDIAEWVRTPVGDSDPADLQFRLCTGANWSGTCYWLTQAQMQNLVAQNNPATVQVSGGGVNLAPSDLTAAGAQIMINTNTAIANMAVKDFQPSCLESGECYVVD